MCCLLLTVVVNIFIHQHVLDFTAKVVLGEMTLEKNSQFLSVWEDSPIVPRLRVFIYNYTNHEDFLAGSVDKIKVEELGPFSYSAIPKKRIYSWEAGKITFRSKTVYHFLNEESALNALNTTIVVPNILLLSGMLKTDVKQYDSFIKENVVWPVLTSTNLKDNVFLKLTVNEFLFGYEDELACLEQDARGEEAFADDFFSSINKRKKRSENMSRTYLREDGRCLFGTLVNQNNTWGPEITALTGTRENPYTKGSITSIDRRPNFEVWPPESSCDTLSYSLEPSALPPIPQNLSHLEVYLGVLCRSVHFRASPRRRNREGISTIKFTPSPTTFTSEDKGCYRRSDESFPFISGVMNVRPCTQGTPIAVSFPHFLHGNWTHISGLIENMSPPTAALHESYFEMEPTLGIPLAIQIRFQVQLMVEPDESFPPLAKLPHPYLLPLFWAQEGFDSRTEGINFTVIKLALLLPKLTSLVLFPAAVFLMSSLMSLCIVSKMSNLGHYSIVPREESRAKYVAGRQS